MSTSPEPESRRVGGIGSKHDLDGNGRTTIPPRMLPRCCVRYLSTGRTCQLTCLDRVRSAPTTASATGQPGIGQWLPSSRVRPERCVHAQWRDRRRRALRDAAGLHRLRFHDLRHTVITELAEMGVADHVLESISGHLSRRMLEHYSHIRLDAKRQALDALDNLRRGGDAANGNESRQTTPRSRRSSRSPTTSRHSHVTVCFCRVPRPPVNC